jgi:hypothetical protein
LTAKGWPVAALVAGAAILMLVPWARDTVLLQNEVGAALPFLVYLFFGLVPAALALVARGWATRPPFLQRVLTTRLEANAWATLFLIVAVEALLDPALTGWLGYDLTPRMASFEGDVVGGVQRGLRNPVLDVIGSAVYSYGYALTYAGVVGVALLRGDRALARPLLFSFINVWLVGLPAYLFLPVDEPWFGSATVVNVLHTTIPPSADNPFLAYSINNELPSLHAALSVACAATLWRIGRRGWFTVVAFPALTLPFFIVYLGIHWATDAVTGVLLGLGAAWLATRSDAAGKPEIPPSPSAAQTSHDQPQR